MGGVPGGGSPDVTPDRAWEVHGIRSRTLDRAWEVQGVRSRRVRVSPHCGTGMARGARGGACGASPPPEGDSFPPSDVGGARGDPLPCGVGRARVFFGRGAAHVRLETSLPGLQSRGVHHRRREVNGVRAAGITPPGPTGAIAEAAEGKGAFAGMTVGLAQAGERPPVHPAPFHEACGRCKRLQAVPVAAHGWGPGRAPPRPERRRSLPRA